MIRAIITWLVAAEVRHLRRENQIIRGHLRGYRAQIGQLAERVWVLTQERDEAFDRVAELLRDVQEMESAETARPALRLINGGGGYGGAAQGI